MRGSPSELLPDSACAAARRDGFPNPHFGFKHAMLSRRYSKFVHIHAIQQHLYGDRARFISWLADGGQRRVHQLGYVKIVETNERDILRITQPQFTNRKQRIHGH